MEHITFDSFSGTGKIHAVEWTPDTEPIAVLQIVHGMAEHVERYDDFAKFLNSKGFVVVADDHLGHGQSATEGIYGYFCEKDPATAAVEDVHKLSIITKEKYQNIPFFVLGHSMGSFITRNYLFRFGSEIDGAIVMGTGMLPKFMVGALRTMASLACAFGKSKKPCEGINSMSFGTYLSRIENPRTPADWLTKDEAIVDKYIEDPLCGFTFTGNGFKTLAELLWRLNDKKNVEKMPKDLKVLIVSGEEDPVGEYGKGPRIVYDSYKELGMTNVDIKLYPSDRHEILNETDKETVYEDIYNWLSKAI